MIRLARWEHASNIHLAVLAAVAVALGFTSLIGSLFLARCAWRRRAAWAAAARRAFWDERPRNTRR